ncbi:MULTISPECIES: SMP-30/gluconolactonase/LRE family protein [Saccharopolyspora]|uniref:Sugar lactone lactonase YvrE n=2 Tax=Saccharopolyspora TaxID=1835 RepID=A0A853AMD6_9PSEU|nr:MULTISPECIES: SMP-30/gluconolactonase/LRE family protein [Saccharopolyspora]KAA5828357.1 SMP-30/gluconolactonase/LRE family protein [Saccharopolyspora hirsuta]NYI84229.1 sugar lactone lactonase YvrE [Saccharopolyspora hordei]
MSVDPVGEVRARFGEGPCWDADAKTLLWVDITGGAVHRTNPADGVTEQCPLGGEVSAVFPTTRGTSVVARDSALLEVSGPDVVGEIASVPPHPRMRFNDGGPDPRGRLLIGTMHADKDPGTAALYRLDDELVPIVTGATVSNGLGCSPDGGLLYYADSPTLRIDVFDYDADAGMPRGRRTFADVSDLGGRPDGLTVDADGCVWVAMIGGSQLLRYTPEGRLDRVVPLPVSHPTSVAFGGADLAELFVTTARDPLSEADLAEQPLAGRLLRLDPGVTGSATPSVRLP